MPPFLCFFSLITGLLILPTLSSAVLVDQFPNPQNADQLARCHIPAPGYLCDADEMLINAEERAELAAILEAFPNQTKNEKGESECKKKGTIVAVALSKEPIYEKVSIMGSEVISMDQAIISLLKNWTFSWEEQHCLRTILLAIPAGAPPQLVQAQMFVNVPLLPDEMKHMLAVEYKLFEQQRWMEAIRNILKGIHRLVNYRNMLMYGDDD